MIIEHDEIIMTIDCVKIIIVMHNTNFSYTPFLQVRQFVKVTAYNCLVRLEYASPVLYLLTKDIDHLEAIQQRAAQSMW